MVVLIREVHYAPSDAHVIVVMREIWHSVNTEYVATKMAVLGPIYVSKVLSLKSRILARRALRAWGILEW
jgi:hypothetical protein